MAKEHDFDAAWKEILEAFEIEIVELLFPEIFNEIDWNIKTESLDKELQEIQKDMFDKASSEKIISDKIIKVALKNKQSKILFIHVEVQSYNRSREIFGERMFRYFYRIWDRFRYKYDDKSEIVAAAIYTYKGKAGKDERYVYRLPELQEEILRYNFRTIDVETMNLEKISNDNPLKLVFKIAKRLLVTKSKDNDIYEAKIKLSEELLNYDKVKSIEQVKALVDFLEYLFLIQDPEMERKYEEYRREMGGVFKMTIDEIRRLHYTQKGREEGIEKGREEGKKQLVLKQYSKGLSVEYIADINDFTIEYVNEVINGKVVH